ncbi:MAG: hypothetical protein BROFUL_03342 [Candidatus Brocadia fulgida]|uniref:Uncharacterized protein n=1 Tax=Candidatus Brocadia fulgida TaxID=380242 RepID=A0A0M2UQN9_9BACT|nr:MAG: hypothetical protein BROFUL_03342 [Candidatus Brocadia fulgida]
MPEVETQAGVRLRLMLRLMLVTRRLFYFLLMVIVLYFRSGFLRTCLCALRRQV